MFAIRVEITESAIDDLAFIAFDSALSSALADAFHNLTDFALKNAQCAIVYPFLLEWPRW